MEGVGLRGFREGVWQWYGRCVEVGGVVYINFYLTFAFYKYLYKFFREITT